MATDVTTLPGIAERTPDDVLDLLGRRFKPEAIRTRAIGGRQVPYVTIDDVISRLNRAAGLWHHRIVSTSLETTPIQRKGEALSIPIWIVTVELTIPGLGAREGIGVATAEGTEDAIKSASSDALKRAAALFGVPIDGGM